MPNPFSALRYWILGAPHHRTALYWLAFTLFGGLLPLYGGAFFLWVLFSRFSWANLVDHGEFGIYSASVLASGLFVVSREYKVPFPERATWVLAAVVLLVLSVFVFSAAFAAANEPGLNSNVNDFAIRVGSPILFSLTMAFVFSLTVRGQGLEEPRETQLAEEVVSIRGEQMATLEDDFDGLGGQP